MYEKFNPKKTVRKSVQFAEVSLHIKITERPYDILCVIIKSSYDRVLIVHTLSFSRLDTTWVMEKWYSNSPIGLKAPTAMDSLGVRSIIIIIINLSIFVWKIWIQIGEYCLSHYKQTLKVTMANQKLLVI